MQGLATIVGFTVLVNSPGQLAGATLSGLVLESSGGNYQAVAWYAGGVMIFGAVVLLYGELLHENHKPNTHSYEAYTNVTARFAHERKILAKY